MSGSSSGATVRGAGRAGPSSALAALAARAATEPDAVALDVEGGDDLTYAAWDARSNAIARGLQSRGVSAADRVALLFPPRRWADFAAAYLGVLKSGGRAVLLSTGAAPADLTRALGRSGATGLVCSPDLMPGEGVMWATTVTDLERDQDGAAAAPPAPLAPLAPLGSEVYAAAPLAPAAAVPLPWEPVAAGELDVDGWLVHAWSPGTVGSHRALRLVLEGRASGAASLAVFDPDHLCALVTERRAAVCGLTPALAAALIASGAPHRHDTSTVIRVEVSGLVSGRVRRGLETAFSRADVVVLDGTVPGAAVRDGAEGRAPVAVSQEPMLWYEQLTPGSFNLPCLVRRYDGPLQVDALEWALSELVRRHQPLRTTFEVAGGVPCQVLGDQDHGRSRLVRVDLAGLDPAEREAAAARLLADATGRPFDLAAGPLFEPRLVRLGPDDHLLVIRLHHTVFDDWSVDVFRREVSALYTARLEGVPSPLAEPGTSFADFSRRQQALLQAGAGAAQRQWWRHELDGAPLSVQLPIGGRSGGRTAPAPAEPLRLDLPPSLAADLRALAPRLRATPFMTVLAAFSVLVARATGLDDLVIGTVVAHRNATDVERLLGCFTKKVPLRLRLGGDPTFSELVARTRSSLLGALAHQDIAFDEALGQAFDAPAADHGVLPQVSVVFQGEAPRRTKMTVPGVTVGPYDVPGEARSERHFSAGRSAAAEWGDGIYLGTFLIVSLLETSEGMGLVARGVFDRPAGRRLLEDFQALLEEVAAAPERRLSEWVATPVPDADVIEVRGFRASRTRLEAALAGCPGVADVAVAVTDDRRHGSRLVAYVVPDRQPPPTLARLRQTLWATLPGALWPAAAVMVESLPRLPDGRLDVAAVAPPDPARAAPAAPSPAPGEVDRPAVAELLAAMWSELAGRAMAPTTSYWHDFWFLQALAEARQAGFDIPDEHVARNRTPETLAAALTAVTSLAAACAR